jgi:hypothetical protein
MRGLLARIGWWPVAGVVISVTFVLSLWSRNLLRLGTESALPTLIGAAALAGLLTFAFALASRSWVRGGIAAALAATYFFYAPVSLAALGLPRVATATMHVLVIVAFVLIYWKIPREPERLKVIATRINLVWLIILAITAIPLLVQLAQLDRARSAARDTFGQLEARADADSPDVWHLLFDRYAANSTLKERYGYDNTPFLDALRTRGFAVNENAYANYQRTAHSVASTMNGALLDPLAAAMHEQQTDWVPIYRAMREGAAIRQFNRMGYRTVFAGSWWEPTRFSESADESIQIRAFPQLARLALDQSAFGFWTRGTSLPWLNGRSDQCFRAKEKFRRLRQLASRTEQKMVFAHFLVPHPPYVLEADGTCRQLSDAVERPRRENYLAQIEFANANVLQLVDSILAGPRRAIIVIHSDEGPWPEPYVGDEHGLGTDPVPVPWAELTDTQLHEKMAILMAVRDPSGRKPQTMPNSPVQIYPAIMRDHFASRANLPSSRNYLFLSDSKLYTFEEVTDRLDLAP